MHKNNTISFRNKVTTLSICFVVAIATTIMLGSGLVLAQAKTPAQSACESITSAFGSACAAGTKDKSEVTNIAVNIITVMSWVIGILAVIMLLVGGFRYIVSGGDSNGISGAKNAIIYAIVGLVIVVLAQVIVRYVISSVAPAPSATPTTKP